MREHSSKAMDYKDAIWRHLSFLSSSSCCYLLIKISQTYILYFPLKSPSIQPNCQACLLRISPNPKIAVWIFLSSKKEDDNFSFPHIMKRIPKLCLPCLQCYNNVCCHKNQIQQYEFISNTFLADLACYLLLVRDFY